jgi:hypothetical protein
MKSTRSALTRGEDGVGERGSVSGKNNARIFQVPVAFPICWANKEGIWCLKMGARMHVLSHQSTRHRRDTL